MISLIIALLVCSASAHVRLDFPTPRSDATGLKVCVRYVAVCSCIDRSFSKLLLVELVLKAFTLVMFYIRTTETHRSFVISVGCWAEQYNNVDRDCIPSRILSGLFVQK